MTQYRATQLETYRRYRDGEYTTYDELIATLKGQTEPNDAMKFGTAVHTALETYVAGYAPQTRDASKLMWNVDGYILAPQSIKQATEGIDQQSSTEVKVSREIFADDGTVLTLTGTCDVVYGTHVLDYKTTKSSITDSKVQAYQESYQWRCYLAMTGCENFTFRIMQWQDDGDFWYISNILDVRCDRYIGMIDDVERLVRELYLFTKDCKELQ